MSLVTVQTQMLVAIKMVVIKNYTWALAVLNSVHTERDEHD